MLGALTVAVDGAMVEIGSAKQRAVIAALALEPGVVVSVDRLVDVLWSEAPPDSAQMTLRSLVYRLRRTLSGDPAVGEEAPWLLARGSGYVIDVLPEAVDAVAFERLVTTARDASAGGEAAIAARALEAGLALWRGAALGDLSSWPFFCTTARRLDEMRLGAVEDLAEAELALGRPGDAVGRLEALVAANPLRERAWGQLMLALYRLGRQADALRAYQGVRGVLIEELGIEPNPALRELESAILQQRADLMPGPIVTPRDFGDTVAFLFTDIESSTRRWEGDQDAMAVNLARHDELLGETCERWGGRVFSHTGDGMCAAFPTAAAAIGAAVAGQGVLANERWEHDEPLPVRMAVHAGAAECRAGNYFGPALNRTARLLASAWGGQIVCSAAAADLAADQFPEQVSLLDLGEQRLADLARPERVFQVVHPGLATEFAPLRSAGAPRHNLPAALTSFVGRNAEIEAVAGLLDRGRLVTLAGAGGAGKTRLALEAAAAVLERFPDGAWLAELAPVRDPDLVPHVLAAALGLDPSGLAASGRPFVEALCDQLRHRRALVVLDNCEHLIDAASVLAHTVLVSCPEVVMLATSREVLAVPGETIVRVGPLGLPPAGASNVSELAGFDAVTLFCERARESVAGFALTEGNSNAVARVCRRLDGSPLALELAASRMRLLSAQQLADRLDDRFRLLADGPRTSDPRHQTLEATIDWSHDLLPERERMVLRRLAVFPSDFDLEAAEAVTTGSDGMDGPDRFEVLGLIGRLADKSLVVVSQADDGASVRYRLLESVRQYAADKLDAAGETFTTHTRHRDFFAAARGWIEELLSGPRLRRVEVEADNLRAALEWSWQHGDSDAALELAGQQWLYWFASGAADVDDWIERAMAVPDGPGLAPLRVQARFARAFTLLPTPGDDVAARFDLLVRDALAIAIEGDDKVGEIWARLCLAQAAAGEGRLEECERMMSELEALHPIRLTVLKAFGEILLAGTALARAELETAQERATRALGLLDANADSWVEVQGLGILALVEATAGEGQLASGHADAAVAAARRIPGPRILVMALTRAAETAVISNRPESAHPHLDEMLGVLRELGSPRWSAEALELSAVSIAPVRPEAAATLLGSAWAIRVLLREEGGVLPILRRPLEACRHHITTSLSESEAVDAERKGAAMHLAEVLAYARAELRATTAQQRG
jgi:predicted ATPase/DNA-binding SARP family transcriptional activator